MNEPVKYTIDDLLGDSPLTRAMKEPVPEAENTFTNGVSPSVIASGEMQGNTTIQSGYLKSKNYVAGVSGWYLDPTTGEFNFAVSVDTLDIPDTTTASSFHVDIDGDTWWGSTLFATAVASISKAGAAIFSSIKITGGSISGILNNSDTDISILEKTHNLVFSVTDADTIAWSAGTITLSNGRTFTISAGGTGNMTLLTYIYLNPVVSETILQKTTTYSNAIGANRVLIGTAKNNTVTASYIPYGPGTPLIDGSDIGALSIVAGNIAASTITAAKMTVSQLSAIAADLGSITAGTIVIPSAGYIRSGQTAFNTGTGWYIGNDGGTPKFSIGVSTGNRLTWDGTTLTVVGQVADVQTFTASGTWTKPAGGTMAHIEVWGGGGSGGVTHVNPDTTSGGGGGGYISLWLPLASLGATETVTIGAGGVAVSTTRTMGNGGGTSSFGAHGSAYGGGGGGWSSTTGGGGGGGSALGAGGAATADSNTAGVAGGGDAAAGGTGGSATAPTGVITGGGGGGQSTSAQGRAGGISIHGGGGGGGSGSSGAGGGGSSKTGGAGGDGQYGATGNANTGSVPGGGGGGKASSGGSGSSGAGGSGKVVVTVI